MKKKLSKALTWYPLFWLALFYSFVLRSYFFLGAWPKPYHPDPKTLNFEIHMIFVQAGLVLLLTLISVLLGIILFYRNKFDQEVKRQRNLFIVFSLFTMAILFFDPGNFWSWFMD